MDKLPFGNYRDISNSSSSNINSLSDTITVFNNNTTAQSLDTIDDSLPFNKEHWFDTTILTKDCNLHVSKFILCYNSIVFASLFETYKNMTEIDLTDYYSIDIQEWLLRWHILPNNKLINTPPTTNIGVYMML